MIYKLEERKRLESCVYENLRTFASVMYYGFIKKNNRITELSKITIPDLLRYYMHTGLGNANFAKKEGSPAFFKQQIPASDTDVPTIVPYKTLAFPFRPLPEPHNEGYSVHSETLLVFADETGALGSMNPATFINGFAGLTNYIFNNVVSPIEVFLAAFDDNNNLFINNYNNPWYVKIEGLGFEAYCNLFTGIIFTDGEINRDLFTSFPDNTIPSFFSKFPVGFTGVSNPLWENTVYWSGFVDQAKYWASAAHYEMRSVQLAIAGIQAGFETFQKSVAFSAEFQLTYGDKPDSDYTEYMLPREVYTSVSLKDPLSEANETDYSHLFSSAIHDFVDRIDVAETSDASIDSISDLKQLSPFFRDRVFALELFLFYSFFIDLIPEAAFLSSRFNWEENKVEYSLSENFSLFNSITSYVRAVELRNGDPTQDFLDWLASKQATFLYHKEIRRLNLLERLSSSDGYLLSSEEIYSYTVPNNIPGFSRFPRGNKISGTMYALNVVFYTFIAMMKKVSSNTTYSSFEEFKNNFKVALSEDYLRSSNDGSDKLLEVLRKSPDTFSEKVMPLLEMVSGGYMYYPDTTPTLGPVDFFRNYIASDQVEHLMQSPYKFLYCYLTGTSKQRAKLSNKKMFEASFFNKGGVPSVISKDLFSYLDERESTFVLNSPLGPYLFVAIKMFTNSKFSHMRLLNYPSLFPINSMKDLLVFYTLGTYSANPIWKTRVNDANCDLVKPNSKIYNTLFNFYVAASDKDEVLTLSEFNTLNKKAAVRTSKKYNNFLKKFVSFYKDLIFDNISYTYRVITKFNLLTSSNFKFHVPVIDETLPFTAHPSEASIRDMSYVCLSPFEARTTSLMCLITLVYISIYKAGISIKAMNPIMVTAVLNTIIDSYELPDYNNKPSVLEIAGTYSLLTPDNLTILHKSKDQVATFVNYFLSAFFDLPTPYCTNTSNRSRLEGVKSFIEALCSTSKDSKSERGKVPLLPLDSMCFDGYTVYHINCPKALVQEGNRMKHCVGQYTDGLRSGNYIFFSIKGRMAKPNSTNHWSTLGLRHDGSIWQHYFFGNRSLNHTGFNRVADTVSQIVKDIKREPNYMERAKLADTTCRFIAAIFNGLLVDVKTSSGTRFELTLMEANIYKTFVQSAESFLSPEELEEILPKKEDTSLFEKEPVVNEVDEVEA